MDLNELRASAQYCDRLRNTAPCNYKPDFTRRNVIGALEIANLIARFLKENTADENTYVKIADHTYRWSCCTESFVLNDQHHVNHSTYVTSLLRHLLHLQTRSFHMCRDEILFYIGCVRVERYPVRHIDVSPVHVQTQQLKTRDQCSTTLFTTLCGDI